MNTGKTLFAQLIDFLPWTTFARIVGRYEGERYVKSLTCAEQFRVMAFAQLTYRESLRDIEVCLSAQLFNRDCSLAPSNGELSCGSGQIWAQFLMDTIRNLQ